MRDINEILNDIEEVNTNDKYDYKQKLEKLDRLGKELEEYEKTEINPVIKEINEKELNAIIIKYKNNEYLTKKEIKKILDASLNYTWNTFKELGIELKRTSLNGMCELAQELSIKPLAQLGIEVTKNNAQKCFGTSLTHYFATATFKIKENETITYIIDPTYIQFYKNSPNKEFDKELIENGYIELTKDNLKKYIQVFKSNPENIELYLEKIKSEKYAEQNVINNNYTNKTTKSK